MQFHQLTFIWLCQRLDEHRLMDGPVIRYIVSNERSPARGSSRSLRPDVVSSHQLPEVSLSSLTDRTLSAHLATDERGRISPRLPACHKSLLKGTRGGGCGENRHFTLCVSVVTKEQREFTSLPIQLAGARDVETETLRQCPSPRRRL